MLLVSALPEEFLKTNIISNDVDILQNYFITMSDCPWTERKKSTLENIQEK